MRINKRAYCVLVFCSHTHALSHSRILHAMSRLLRISSLPPSTPASSTCSFVLIDGKIHQIPVAPETKTEHAHLAQSSASSPPPSSSTSEPSEPETASTAPSTTDPHCVYPCCNPQAASAYYWHQYQYYLYLTQIYYHAGPSPNNAKPSLYKTQLCKSYTENAGMCRYGWKCQFAHGVQELRGVRQT